MTYVEIAVSDGPGTLRKHIVNDMSLWHSALLLEDHLAAAEYTADIAFTTLTESEYQDFIAMHGGPVAT